MQRTAIIVNGITLYVNSKTNNVKLGSKGKATPITSLYAQQGKGTARKIRKGLRANGMACLASL